ncbi:Na/Pi cotransporter family protein [Primorskyibacter flagellatus]|uniref:Na/Pi cotransporter family protein n=1 Tax=Primorskyibacter flagellatus TaxID=1387277 RepID=UPI0009FD48C4|nr:Na/Pi cotransporter family protein [Primorskyibacter flagellatus]
MTSALQLIELLGAGALVLWALRIVKSGVLSGFGASLRQGIAKGTGNRVVAAISGLFATILVQSSTATAVIAASFVYRNIVAPRMAQAVLLGANLGTALTAAILVNDLHWLSPVLVLSGVVTHSRSRLARGRGIGEALIGLGLMLFALDLLGTATEPLQAAEVTAAILSALDQGPIFGLLLAAILAFASSSSLAVVLFIAMLAEAGTITPSLVVALVAGANLGGAVLPCLAVASEGPEARRLVNGNLTVRGTGALVALVTASFTGPLLADLLPSVGCIAIVAHLGFNAILLLLFLPLLGPFERITRQIWPDPDAEQGAPSYLDDAALDTPALALGGAVREVLRIGDNVALMMELNLRSLLVDDPEASREIARLDDRVDAALSEVKMYFLRLGRKELPESASARMREVLSYAINLEHVGDIIDRDLSEMARKKAERQVKFSAAGEEEIGELYRKTLLNLELAQSVFHSRDIALARRLTAEKVHVRQIEERSQKRHIARLQAGQPETLGSTTLHLDILRDLKRINAHIAAVSYPILSEAGELSASRVLSLQDVN